MNPVCKLFNIDYPIIQGGMIWCSDWKLVTAVSNAGGLGLIGAGSMDADTLKFQIQNCRKNTSKPWGVNIPLISKNVDELIEIILREKVEIVFTSAGNPATWTNILHDNGIIVAHVVANTKFALKAHDAGVDAIVAEGFEAGGHNGREETTTLVLIPAVRQITGKPLIAAGGIAAGSSMLAAMVLGADGVQIGTRFVASTESSAHSKFKEKIIQAGEGDTKLMMKKLIPVRLLKNNFSIRIENAEDIGADKETLSNLLGRGRAKLGMHDGDIDEGELEIGQASAIITGIKDVKVIIDEMIEEYKHAINNLINKFSINI